MKSESAPIPPPPCGEKKNVVVLGAGVTGILSAWELARAGHNVTVLEARKIGNGASSRSAACIRQQFSTPSTVRGMRYCVGFYAMWTKLVGNSQVPIVHNGYLFLKDVVTDTEAVQAMVAMQHAAGLMDVEWLNRNQIRDRFGYLETTDIVGATWCPTDGFLLPHVIYNDGAMAAKELGVQIVQDAEVVSATKSGSTAISVTTKDGRSFEGDTFINATNVWAPELSRMFGGIPLDITTRRRYLYFIKGPEEETLSLGPENMPRVPMTISPRGCYVRPDGPQFMMGWAHYTNPVLPSFDDQDTIESGFGYREREGLVGAIHKELVQYLPVLSELGAPTAVTGGYYDDSRDRNPLIGYDPNVPNLIHAAGFSGHGLMHAPFSACIVANLVAEDHNFDEMELPLGFGTVDLKPYRIDRKPVGGESMVI